MCVETLKKSKWYHIDSRVPLKKFSLLYIYKIIDSILIMIQACTSICEVMAGNLRIRRPKFINLLSCNKERDLSNENGIVI